MQELIDFMFRRDAAGKLDAMACLELWFGKSHDTDNAIRSHYGDLVKLSFRPLLDSDSPRKPGSAKTLRCLLREN